MGELGSCPATSCSMCARMVSSLSLLVAGAVVVVDVAIAVEAAVASVVVASVVEVARDAAAASSRLSTASIPR